VSADRQCQVTDDGRFKIGDVVTISLDWAHQIRRHVYDGRKTIEEVRAMHTGPILEIWTGGSDAHPWWSLKLGCPSASPWEMPDDLEHVTATPPVPDVWPEQAV
jgi:hypothetical protein